MAAKAASTSVKEVTGRAHGDFEFIVDHGMNAFEDTLITERLESEPS